ncbi:Uncharacterised protein [Streptococcus pneumoniae]|nr:Uncharacterised protein [Streptococcus pneumoniae]CJC49752.1 Uncharacterised protein [Streptococcus pneumoniae]CJJ34407.1 Uncharacterised protein [Streptococcus pneumoniae]
MRGGAEPICTIIGNDVSRDKERATCSGSIPLSQTTLLLILAFNPTITSLYFSTASITFSLSIHSILDNSSIRFKPMREIFKKANKFVFACSLLFTKSAMRSAPQLPASTIVVTPCLTPISSTSSPYGSNSGKA